MKLAALDIGSYSVRLLIAEISNGDIKILLEKGAITSLGSGLRSEGYLKPDRIEETLKVLRHYKEDVERSGVESVFAVATEAIRRAKNGKDFIELVKREIGFDVELISPEKEGKLAFLATAYSLKPKDPFLVVDQGGASTEFIYGSDFKAKKIISLPIGIVNLTESFLKHDPPLDTEIENLFNFLRRKIPSLKENIQEIIGLGGTITTVAALEYGVYPYEPQRIHGKKLSLENLEHWFKELVNLPSHVRKEKYRQIEDKRAKVLPAGIAMFIEILRTFGKDKLTVGDWGVKHGIIVKYILSKGIK